ncbi:MAG TPA: ferritin-like domain-containing protein, partial [Pseudonocardiaceae bacterium]|nr:ferritin-like domain-containing protein [Pseudonocardiaceae bacterium]
SHQPLGGFVQNKIDEGRFRELLEESDDLQSDAMRTARTGLNDYVEAAREACVSAGRDASRWGTVAPAAGVSGAAMLLTGGTAWAAAANDIAALQTAAGVENLAVMTYKTALTLPFIGGSSANPVVKAFATKTMDQHNEHAMAFNAAAQRLGGKPQTGPDPKYAAVVQAAVPKIKGAVDVVGLAITLEDVAAQTYVKNVGLVSTTELRQLFASVAGVESQHKAILLAVQALVKANQPQLITLPPDIAKLPAAAGSVGFPDSFYPTTMAAPVDEGAVR